MRLPSRALPADRYCKFKNRADGIRLDEPQFASVIFYHVKTDRESQSCATGFCGKERIEYALPIPGRNSGPGVLDRDQYGRMTVETRREAQKSGSRGHGAHCLDSVLDEVQEDLLELRAIQGRLGKVVLKLSSNGHFVDLKIVLQQSQYDPNRILNACQRPLVSRLFRQFANARNDSSRATAVGLYIIKDVVYFF